MSRLSWWAGGVLLLLACGGRSALDSSSVNAHGPLSPGGASTNDPSTASGRTPMNPARVIAITAGYVHTCGLDSSGTAKCWGYNDLGQVGDGSRVNRLLPTDVADLAPGVLGISAGGHSCAVTASGGAKCWGPNTYRELGRDLGNSLVPGDVDGLSMGVTSLSAGGFATCAIHSTDSLRCWGYPEIGNGRSVFPLDIAGLTSVISVSVGAQHVCAVTSFSAVKCWGQNRTGALGNSSTRDSTVPVDVEGLSSGVRSVSAGFDHTCALTLTGGVTCWGSNWAGQLGVGSTANSLVPVPVVGLSSGVKAISAGYLYSCAVTITGGVKCWGSYRWGAVDNLSTTSTSLIPVDIVGLSKVVSVSVGESHACALASSGSAKCWGRNEYGQLGNPSTTGSAVPVDVLWR